MVFAVLALFAVCAQAVGSLLVVLVGLAVRLDLFVRSNFLLLLLVLLVYQLAMAACALALASMLSRARTAALVAFALLLPCAALCVLSGIWAEITYCFWEDGTCYRDTADRPRGTTAPRALLMRSSLFARALSFLQASPRP